MADQTAPRPQGRVSAFSRRLGCGLTLVVLLVASASAQEKAAVQPTQKPFLWQIAGPTPSYLYGTIHVPDEQVLALPRVVEEALAASDALFLEIPMDMSTLTASMSKMMLPGDKTLSDVLPPPLYRRTDKYLESKGVNLAMFEKQKVWAIMAQLPLLDYLKELATRQPLDLALYMQAAGQGKELGGIETVDEQIGALESLTQDEQIKMLAKTLDVLEEAVRSGKSHTQSMVKTYLSGDEQALLDLMNEDLDLDDPVDRKLYDNLIIKRNERMAERVAKQLKAQPDTAFFFAFGAGHMGGPKGVVPLLKAQGVKLRRLTAADAGRLPKPKKP